MPVSCAYQFAYQHRALFRVRCKYNDLLNINAIHLTRYNIKTNTTAEKSSCGCDFFVVLLFYDYDYTQPIPYYRA